MAQFHLLTSRGARAAALILQKEINIVFGGPILLASSNPAQIVGPGLGSSRRIKRLHVHLPVSPAEEEGGGRLAGFIARDKNGGGKKQLLYFQVISPSLTSRLVRFSAAPLKRFSAFLCYS